MTAALRCAGALALACLSAPLWASDTQALTAITAAARKFLDGFPFASPHPVSYRLAAPARHLRLRPCSSPLEANFAPGARAHGRSTVRVRCPAVPHWQINLAVHLSVLIDIVQVARPVARGQQLSAGDLRLHTIERSRLPGDYFSEIEQAVGQVARHTLRRDQLLSARAVAPKKLIKRGDLVVLSTANDLISIATRGRALDDALHGQSLRVKNLDSGRVVEGIARAAGTVIVPL